MKNNNHAFIFVKNVNLSAFGGLKVLTRWSEEEQLRIQFQTALIYLIQLKCDNVLQEHDMENYEKHKSRVHFCEKWEFKCVFGSQSAE